MLRIRLPAGVHPRVCLCDGGCLSVTELLAGKGWCKLIQVTEGMNTAAYPAHKVILSLSPHCKTRKNLSKLGLVLVSKIARIYSRSCWSFMEDGASETFTDTPH